MSFLLVTLSCNFFTRVIFLTQIVNCFVIKYNGMIDLHSIIQNQKEIISVIFKGYDICIIPNCLKKVVFDLLVNDIK